MDGRLLVAALGGALVAATALTPRGSAARAPGRIRRADWHEVEELFHEAGINIADYEEPYEAFEHDGKVLGVSTFGWYDRYGTGERVASFSVAVARSARRRGIGERLVKSLVRKHPGARFEPWVVSPKMAKLLEGLGFDSEGREWTPDSPHMTYEAPTRAEARARRQSKAEMERNPPPPPVHVPPPPWTEDYREPALLYHLDLADEDLAKAVELRRWYARHPEERRAKVAELLATPMPIPGMNALTSPKMGSYWQMVLKVDPKGNDERRDARLERLARRP